jgi:nitrite reductase/ring-hydroxylating ferredoxin subunit
MERAERHAITRQILTAVDSGLVADYGEESWETDIGRFTDQARFESEKQKLFLERPQLIALTGDLPEPGDYFATEIAGKPILLVRGKDGKVGAFLNACRHRGVKLAEGCGHAARFTCPYHGWTFATDGALVGVPSRESFDEDQLMGRGLVRLPVAEEVGCILVHPQPDGHLDFDAFMGPMKGMLADFKLAELRLVKSYSDRVPINWKHLTDGGLEAYHVPYLHADTFGTAPPPYMPHLDFGDHHSLVFPLPAIETLKGVPEEEWPDIQTFASSNAIFPSTFIGGIAPVINLVRADPGAKAGESVYRFHLYARPNPTAEEARLIEQQGDFLWRVYHEDLAVQVSQQQMMESGAVPSVIFGKREILLTRMHRSYDAAVGHDAAAALRRAAQ